MMTARMRFRRGLLIVGVVVLAASATLGSASQPNVSEHRAWGLVNGSRAVYSRSGLSWNIDLWACARQHAEDMAARGTIYHSTHSQLYHCSHGRGVGENVGMGGTLYTIHEAFWASPGHRSNILDTSWHRLGTGAVYRDGTFYVDYMFSS